MAHALRRRLDRGISRHRRDAIAVSIVLTVVLMGGSGSAGARPKVRERVALATRFMVRQQQPDGSFPALSSDPISWTADAVATLAVAGRASKAAARGLDYLVANDDEVDSVGTRSKVLLALVAAGRDPSDFAGRDLVTEIESSQQTDGRYGLDTSVFSHSLAILALAGAGATSTLDAAAAWLVEAQCGNGGWQVTGPPTPLEDRHCSFGYPDIDEANTDTTSLAVQALSALPGPVLPASDPFAFLDTLRDHANGGWTYDRPASVHANFTSAYSNANSTAMVLQAYSAAGREPPPGSRSGLVKLQDPLCGDLAGSFSYTWGDEDGDGTHERSGTHNLAATIAAVPGLLGAELPQPGTSSWRPPPRAPECVADRAGPSK